MGGRARGLWMVGPEVGTFSGGLANRADKTCVEEVDSVWKFADGTSWVKDPLLKVSCEKDFTGRTFLFDALVEIFLLLNADEVEGMTQLEPMSSTNFRVA